MATISLTLPSDGDTIDASDVNTPFNTIANAINGNLDSTNVSAGGITPANLTSGTGTTWVWQNWTPTYANLTTGNGTVVAKYSQIGKLVHAYWSFTLGSTSAVGTSPTVSVPGGLSANYTGETTISGSAYALDAANNIYPLFIDVASTISLRAIVTSGTYATSGGGVLSATIPFTWGTADVLGFDVVYETA